MLKTQLAAKEQGYDDVVYLDAVSDTYLEEVSSCNIFVVKGNTIKTPPLQVTLLACLWIAFCLLSKRAPDPDVTSQGTILPGVTRKSVLELARLRGYKVEEAPVSVEEAMASDEVFTTGTAVVLCAVGSLTYKVRSACCSQ